MPMSYLWDSRRTAKTEDPDLPLVAKFPETRVWRLDFTHQRLAYSTNYRRGRAFVMSPAGHIEILFHVQRTVRGLVEIGSCLRDLSIEHTWVVLEEQPFQFDVHFSAETYI